MAAAEVPLRDKVLYGSGEITSSAKNTALNQFLLFFYADIVHPVAGAGEHGDLRGQAVGRGHRSGDGLPLGYDALALGTPPAVRCRRCLPVGLFFFLVFSPPALGPAGSSCTCSSSTRCSTPASRCSRSPYTAWGAELAQDYHERTTVVQIRSLFGVVGGVIGATAPIAIAKQFADQRCGVCASWRR